MAGFGSAEEHQEGSFKAPRLVASTGDEYNRQPHSKSLRLSLLEPVDTTLSGGTNDEGNFRSMLWSADGTTLVTQSADQVVRSFILPVDLLSPLPGDGVSEKPASPTTLSFPETPASRIGQHHHLIPYSTHLHPTTLRAFALSPSFTIQYPQTSLILTSPSYLPLRLISPFAPRILATYPLIRPTTEAWIAPHSILFASPYVSTGHASDQSAAWPTHFLAGSDSCISCFDLSRDGDGPSSSLATTAGGRKARRGGAPGMRGIVSALALSSDGVLAAGTYSRGVGLYDGYGLGDTIGAFQLDAPEPLKTPDSASDGRSEGRGVTEVKWSSCDRYLVVAERMSGGMGVWDIRFSGRRLAWLSGRKANTMQRLSVEIAAGQGGDGDEVWTGGTDGVVRVWRGLGIREGAVEPDWGFKAHEDTVSSVRVHSCGNVIATCSGSRHRQSDNDSTRDLLSPSTSKSSSSGSEEDLQDVSSGTSSSSNEGESGGSQGIRREAATVMNLPGTNSNARDNSIRVWSLE